MQLLSRLRLRLIASSHIRLLKYALPADVRFMASLL
jgi:hypothetical protein